MTLALTERIYRERALWVALLLVAATLAGSWIYDSVGQSSAANFVADRFVPFSLAPGAEPDAGYDASGLTAGAVNTALCYVTVNGRIWLDFGNDDYLPITDVHPAPGYPARLPSHC